MNFLATDTTDQNLVVVVGKDGKLFKSVINVGRSGHSKLLLPEIAKVMKEAELEPENLDVVASVVGPGSFTGIRIGVATMTGISYAVKAKRVEISSFDLLGYGRQNEILKIEAGHGNLYIANLVNGKVENPSFMEAEVAEHTDTSNYVSSIKGEIADTLFNVTLNKIENDDFVNILQPYYMRKSQAERNIK